MKKFLVFIISFAILHTISQTVSGIILTKKYLSELTKEENVEKIFNQGMGLNQAVDVGNTSFLSFGLALASAAIAYFVAHQVERLRGDR